MFVSRPRIVSAIYLLGFCASCGASVNGDSSTGKTQGAPVASTFPIALVSAPNKCLGVRGANVANGTVVQIYDCNGTAEQQWTYTQDTFQALGKCLDVVNGSTANGASLQIWDCETGRPVNSLRSSARQLFGPVTTSVWT